MKMAFEETKGNIKKAEKNRGRKKKNPLKQKRKTL